MMVQISSRRISPIINCRDFSLNVAKVNSRYAISRHSGIKYAPIIYGQSVIVFYTIRDDAFQSWCQADKASVRDGSNPINLVYASSLLRKH